MKKLVCKLLVMVMMVTMFTGYQTEVAHAASTTNRVPIICYTISTGRVTTYRSAGGSYSGYIDGAVDQVRILSVGSNGWCQVKYPVSNGYKTAYTQSANLFSNTNFSTTTTKIGKRKTVYRRSDLSQSLGTVYANDNVVVIGTSGNATQIIYPISSGYKMGWISGTYSESGNQNASVANGYYQIKSAINSKYVLDVYNADSNDGANVQLYENHYSMNQGFEIKKQRDGYYTITALHSGKALDVEGGGSYSGVNILQWTSHGGDNQKWKIVKTSDGYYSFISKGNGLYLDANGAVAANETNIQCWTGNGSKAQKFILQSVSVSGKEKKKNTKTNDVNYASYTGVDYKNAGLSAERIRCLDKAVQLCTVKWTAPVTFTTWQASNGEYNYVRATDGTYTTSFVEGKTYVGIPYSMADHSYDDVKWSNLVNQGFSSQQMTTSYQGRRATTAHGIDCSYLTYLCFCAANTSRRVPYEVTSVMMTSGNYKRKSINSIKGGDIALNKNHVMLYVGRSGNKYAFIEASANDSKVSYNVYTESQLKSYTIYKFVGFSD